MSLHRAHLKTPEELKEIICCETRLIFLLENNKQDKIINLEDTVQDYRICQFCYKDLGLLLGVMVIKGDYHDSNGYGDIKLLDIDEKPLSQDEVNALLHNGVSQ